MCSVTNAQLENMREIATLVRDVGLYVFHYDMPVYAKLQVMSRRHRTKLRQLRKQHDIDGEQASVAGLAASLLAERGESPSQNSGDDNRARAQPPLENSTDDDVDLDGLGTTDMGPMPSPSTSQSAARVVNAVLPEVKPKSTKLLKQKVLRATGQSKCQIRRHVACRRCVQVMRTCLPATSSSARTASGTT